MKAIPQVHKYMSTTPFTVGAEQTLRTAQQLLREHEIRHLPVLHGGRLHGIISERDIALIENLDGVDPDEILVEDAMTTGIYEVRPDAPLDEVAAEMAEHKYGSAIVVDHQKVVGILTTVDICRALSELLQTRLKG